MTLSPEKAPNPGSHEARRQGCKCDMLRNQYGLGAYVTSCGKQVWEIERECRLHGAPDPRALTIAAEEGFL